MLGSREPSQSDALYTASIHCHLPGEITLSAIELTFVAKSKFLSGDLPSCDGLILLEDDAKWTLLVNPTTKEVVSPSNYFMEHEFAMVDHVYSVRNGTRTEADSSLMCFTRVFVDGSLHWVATNTSNYSSFIVGFDLAEKKLEVILAPRLVCGVDFTYDIVGELGRCLSTLSVLLRKETNIWVMKEYGVEQSWTKFSIVGEVLEYMPLLCVPGRREVVMVKDEHIEDEDWVIYNLDCGTFKSITIQDATYVYFKGCFRETLVSPYFNHDPQRA
ncbi:hypothetical protein RND81_03G116800 [Saponaria officinalis]|uniref:F-box associated beta-propeller type 1 domain-containing protein n=1 Tax=Saponaria officinalis TaxID=3572 RepID=A0AAW1M6F2_SAPOF